MSRNILVRFWKYPIAALGPERRLGIWTQGCSIHCRGCIAPEHQPFDESFAVPLDKFIEDITPALNQTSGVTISGGEPLDQADVLIDLLREINKFGVDDILLYSGYSSEKILAGHPELSGLIAALIDGPFVEGALSGEIWKGSDNQTLTIFNEKYRLRYENWSRLKRRNFQLINTDAGRYLIGIPEQDKDWKNKILNLNSIRDQQED